MAAHFEAYLVDVLERGAGELKLTAGLEGHRSAGARQGDQRAAGRLGVGVPAVTLHKGLQDRENAPVAAIGERGAGRSVHTEFLRFSADPELGLRLDGFVEWDEEVVERRQGLAALGHRSSSRGLGQWVAAS